MQYALLFPELENVKPVKKAKVKKAPRRRQHWEDREQPELFAMPLFADSHGTHIPPGPQRVPVYENRHESRVSLYHPNDHNNPIDYFDCLWKISEEMRRQDLQRRGLLRFASGVFLADIRNPSKGYRVQVWDSNKRKKQHVAYKDTREEAELELRKYWKAKGIDIRVELPEYFMELLEDAIAVRKNEAK